ncbi:MAG: cytochrome c oxidase subunit II [Rhodospirillales bacterium]|mgnify:CR=1 FL=1|nr:cytochrome c oxidase subunit II [Rhodospirillales bacterium]
MLKRLMVLAPLAALGVVTVGGSVVAGIARPWQLGLQEPMSPVMEKVDGFHDFLLVIITLIALFVLALVLYVAVRFNEKANPVPSKTTHNSLLEVLWTVIPVIILVVIAVPSFKLLYYQDRVEEADMTLKVIGHQWYWSYEYPDHGNFGFDSIMVPDDELEEGQPRLLATDNKVVLPVDTNIRILYTSEDVIHAWAIPALIQKMDTVPGRTNENWMRINKEGTYYGQCSELCGVNHGFMPIVVEAVSKEAFAGWVKKAKEEFASSEVEPLNMAHAAGAAQ